MDVVYFQTFIGRMGDKARYYQYTTLHETQERELLEIKIGQNILVDKGRAGHTC